MEHVISIWVSSISFAHHRLVPNFGHKENKCRPMEATIEPKFLREQNLSWKRKPSKKECLISLKIQENEDLWYVDNGCSKHMTGNRDKFETLKKQKGKVIFGDNASGNIIGKVIVSLGKYKAKNVLLVENLKPSLLSVSQTWTKGIFSFLTLKNVILEKRAQENWLE
jgi:hypothetical protein